MLTDCCLPWQPRQQSAGQQAFHQALQISVSFRRKAKKEEKFTLFSDHNGSLLRQQPGAVSFRTCISDPAYQGYVFLEGCNGKQQSVNMRVY